MQSDGTVSVESGHPAIQSMAIDWLLITVFELGILVLILWFLAAGSPVVAMIPPLILIAATVTFKRSARLRAALDTALSRNRRLAYALGAICLMIVPFLVGDNGYTYNLLIISMLYGIVAVALNFQLGSANLPNFASGASYGIGAYAGALLMIGLGINFWVALVAAAVVSAFFGFLLGIPCMRTKDYYLALVTIAYAIVVYQLLNNLSFTGGSGGLVGVPTPSVFGHSFQTQPKLLGYTLSAQANFYWLTAIILIFAIYVGQRVHNSRVGLAWNAIGLDDIAASSLGINVVRYKVLAFVLDAFIASLAGTIYASYTSYISPTDFTFLVSLVIITMVIVGGIDNVFGAIAGAFILVALPEKFRFFDDYRLLLYSIVVILVMLFRPKGLIPRRIRRY